MRTIGAEFLPLCHRDDVAIGAARGFLPAPGARRKIIVLNRGEGRFLAYWDACPHYTGGTPMAWRADAYLSGDGRHLSCHAHGALFDIETGDCIDGPCLGRRLTRVPLVMAPDGMLHVPAHLAGKGREK